MKKNILLVEYSSEAIEKIQQTLHHKVFDITVARSEEVARDLLGNFRFDLLITETLLPKSHGYVLSKYVSETYPGTKIIIISEKLKAADSKSEAVSQHGASDFFEKPLHEKAFKKRVLEVLDITEADLREMDDSSDQTTKLHVIPTLAELEAARGKSGKKGTPGKPPKEKEETPIIKIDLD
jgi:DNA-binding NtrC family response regulator